VLPVLLSLAAATLPPVIVEGNQVLPDDVYRTVLALSVSGPDAARTSTIGLTATASASGTLTTSVAEALTSSVTPTEQMPRWAQMASVDPEAAAAEVRAVVLDFLIASGYELARVQARVTSDGVVLDIDEGQLDKVIFLREGTLANIELRFALHLPSEVFNRPLLEEKLAKLIADSDITAAHWELVPTRPVEHAGIQVEEPRLIRGLRLLNPGAHHELHIRLERSIAREGLDVGLGLSGSDGLFVKAGYRIGDVIFSKDRLHTEARAGFYLGNGPESDRNPLGVSRLRGMVRWSPIPLGFEGIRAFAELDANLFGRRRDDLAIANYYFMPIAASVVIEAQILEGVTMTLGAGGEQRFLFGLDTPEEAQPLIDKTADDDLRFFLTFGAEWILDPKELRADRQHRAALNLRFLGAGQSERAAAITKAYLEYENTISLGWDELRYGFHGAHQWGRVPYYDELSIGDGFLRSGFGTQIYTNRAAAIALEYRISLSRDTLKVSVFNDAAVYQRLDDLREEIDYPFADTFGGGLHVLFFDAFQLNTYVGVTVDQALGLDLGVKVELTRAF